MTKRATAMLLALMLVFVSFASDAALVGEGLFKAFAAEPEAVQAEDISVQLVDNDAEYAVLSSEDGEYKMGYVPDPRVLTSTHYDRDDVLLGVLPSAYNSVEKGMVTSVKDQNPFGTCWGFSSINCVESSLLSAGEMDNPDFSELHLVYFTYNRPTDPLGLTAGDKLSPVGEDLLDRGGNYTIAMYALTSGMGPVDESVMDYDTAALGMTADSSLAYLSEAKINNVYEVSAGNSDRIKELVMQYGSVGMSYYHSSLYYNSTTAAYNNTQTAGTNHAVSIVGWDDNYSKDNFKAGYIPAADGAWLIKNSWNTYWGDDGYFWMSYEDMSFAPESDGTYNTCFAYDVTADVDENEYIYQYDGGSSTSWLIYNNVSSVNVGNVYTAFRDEVIKSASVVTLTENMGYSLQIYRNPAEGNPSSGEAMLSTPVTGEFLDAGFHNVEIPEEISVKEGDKFAAVFTLMPRGGNINLPIDRASTNNVYKYETAQAAGQSFFGSGSSWTDAVTRGYTMRVKVFTTLPEAGSAEDEGKCGDNLTWSIDDNGNLKISGSGSMYDFSDANPAPWSEYISSIKSITVSGAASIGANAFAGCTALEKVTLSDGLASIGANAFKGCTALARVLIPASITSIGDYAFDGSGLRFVLYPSSQAEWNKISLGTNAIPSSAVFAFNYDSSKKVTRISLSSSEANLLRITEGASVTPSFTLTPADTTDVFILTSADESIASVSGGVITGVKSGRTKITVSASNGLSYTFDVVVRILDSIEITTYPSKLEYRVGEELDLSDMVVKAVYSDGLSNVITDYTVSGYDKSVIGNQTVTVSYTDSVTKSASFEVAVISQASISGTCGDNLRWVLDENGVLSINGTGRMENYFHNSSIFAPWYEHAASIKKVVVNSGATHIGSSAFYGCTALENVVMADSVTSMGNYVFYGCTALRSAILSENITTMGSNTFRDCAALKSINLPDSITAIGTYAFYGCDALTEVVIPGGTASIDNYAFYSCDSLETVSIPASVTSIGYSAFHMCSALKNVTLPAGLTTINPYAFYGCSSLESVSIPAGVSTVSSMAFNSCTALKKVTIADGVTTIDSSAFNGCKALAQVVVPKSVTSIGSSAFPYTMRYLLYSGTEEEWNSNVSGISNINSNTIIIFNYDSSKAVSEIALDGEQPLRMTNGSRIMPAFILTPADTTDVVTFVSDNESVVLMTTDGMLCAAGNGTATVTATATSGASCTFTVSVRSIQSIEVTTLPAKVEYRIGDELDLAGMVVTATYSDGESVAVEGYNVSGFDSTAAGTKKLTVTYKDGLTRTTYFEVTVVEGIGTNGVGGSCGENLVWHITADGEMTISGTGEMSEFYINTIPWKDYLSYIKTLTVNEGVESITESVFRDCTALESVSLPNTLKTIGNAAFDNCDSLVSITIPDSVETIGEFAFSGCAKLAEVNLGSGLTVIEASLFRYDDAIKSIVIPDSVTTIKNDVFNLCRGIESITIPPSVTEIDSTAFKMSTLKTIFGYKGSRAESFAAENNYEFVDITPKIVVGIRIANLPDKLIYAPGEKVVTDGIRVEAVYLDGSTVELRFPKYVVSGRPMDNPGIYTYAASHNAGTEENQQWFKEYFNVLMAETEGFYADTSSGSIVFCYDIPEQQKLAIGSTLSLADILPVEAANASFTWTAETENIVSVENGIITGLANGSTKLVGTDSEGNFRITLNAAVETAFTASPASPQPINTPITLTAAGGHTYRFYCEQNGKWFNIQNYSTANTCVWTPSEAKDYNLYVDVKDANGVLTGCYRIEYTVTDPYTVSVSESSPVNIGDIITISAQGGATYKFYYEFNGGWGKIQDYSSSNTATWTPKTAGNYLVYVDIKDASGKLVAAKSMEYIVEDTYVFETDSAAVQNLGASIGFTASGGTTYKFYYELDGKWVKIQDFSEKSSCTWTPTMPGSYNVYVDVKNEAGTTVACRRMTFTITDPYSIGADLESPQAVGEKIVLSAEGGKDGYTYKFYYELDGKWNRIKDFSESSTCTWTPKQAGDYVVYVDIKDENGQKVSCKGIQFTIGEPAAADDGDYTFTASVSGPQNIGTPITLTATGGSSYRFYYEQNGKWVSIKNSSAGNSCTWTPTKAQTYVLYVDIKNESGSIVACRRMSYTITDPYTFTVGKTSPQNIGESISMSAAGGASYKFYYEYNGNWGKIQDYSSSASATWKPKTAGNYLLYVDIKNADGKIIATRSIEYVINDQFTFTSDAAEKGSLGNKVTFEATGGATYKFYYEQNGKWVRIQNFSTATTCTWTPVKAGEYNVYVDIKDENGVQLTCRRMVVRITDPYSISASTTEAEVGKAVTLTATGNEGCTYKFYYELDGQWVRIKNFSAATTCTWYPKQAGDYVVYVDIKDASGNQVAFRYVNVTAA